MEMGTGTTRDGLLQTSQQFSLKKKSRNQSRIKKNAIFMTRLIIKTPGSHPYAKIRVPATEPR